MTRLMKSLLGSSGKTKTTMSPRFGVVKAKIRPFVNGT